jgi:type II secretory pathway pseudopilin PulG
MTRFCTTRRHAGGFSLIEVAIAVFVIVILLGSLVVPLTAQVEQRQLSDTEKTLAEARDALAGFAMLNGYLPCPDTGGTGLETVNAASGQCGTITGGVACGRLPHASLGLARADAWGNRLTYCVNELFARRAPATAFTLSTGGTDVRICTTQACTTTLSSSAVFALVSHGKNGYGATKLDTGAQNPPSPSADEQENYDNNDRNLVSRTHTAASSSAGEFDDIVVWLPRFTLFNRMVTAGRLP